MRKIKIITDSGCDMPLSEANENDVSVLPLKTIFKDKEYLSGVNLTNEEFYHKLIETNEIPKTSQINAFTYEEEFKKYQDYDILVITISKKISGCYNSALIASEEYKNVYIVDSENVAIGELILVQYATKLVKEGLSINEVIEKLNNVKKRIYIIGLLDTLEYLKKGGRISLTKAMIGTILSIKPVVSVSDGKIVMIGKARGSKNGQNMLRTLIKESKGIDYNMPFACAYTGLSSSLVEKYIDDSKDIYTIDSKDVPIYCMGSTIGTHVGPNAIAVAFFVEE